MIKYSLKCKSLNCSNKKNFDGWFQNIVSFEYQQSKGLLTCPICGGDNIIKLLTTPSFQIANKNTSKIKDHNREIGKKNNHMTSDFKYNTNNLTAVLRVIKKEIQKNSEYVGNNLAKEARKMEEGKIEKKSIYGHGTKVEIEELKDDGIDVVTIPWVPDDQ